MRETNIFLQEHLHNKYTSYAFAFFCCEVGNLAVVISQIFFTNKFLNYSFLFYGFRVWNYYSMPPEERELLQFNPMCETFPRLASCDYYRWQNVIVSKEVVNISDNDEG